MCCDGSEVPTLAQYLCDGSKVRGQLWWSHFLVCSENNNNGSRIQVIDEPIERA